jgi:xanthine dehydrogenase accessory factor
MGVGEDQIGRLEHPFGLISRARDPRTLAVGVLAQVLDRARFG